MRLTDCQPRSDGSRRMGAGNGARHRLGRSASM